MQQRQSTTRRLSLTLSKKRRHCGKEMEKLPDGTLSSMCSSCNKECSECGNRFVVSNADVSELRCSDCILQSVGANKTESEQVMETSSNSNSDANRDTGLPISTRLTTSYSKYKQMLKSLENDQEEAVSMSSEVAEKHDIDKTASSSVMESNKRKRPDRTLSLKKRKLLHEHVVKASLNGILNEELVRKEIDDLVIYLSKLHNKGCLVINRLLLHCICNDVELPDLKDQNFYRQCLLVGMEGSTCKFLPIINELWNNVFKKKLFPTLV